MVYGLLVVVFLPPPPPPHHHHHNVLFGLYHYILFEPLMSVQLYSEYRIWSSSKCVSTEKNNACVQAPRPSHLCLDPYKKKKKRILKTSIYISMYIYIHMNSMYIYIYDIYLYVHTLHMYISYRYIKLMIYNETICLSLTLIFFFYLILCY